MSMPSYHIPENLLETLPYRFFIGRKFYRQRANSFIHEYSDFLRDQFFDMFVGAQ